MSNQIFKAAKEAMASEIDEIILGGYDPAELWRSAMSQAETPEALADLVARRLQGDVYPPFAMNRDGGEVTLVWDQSGIIRQVR